MKKKISLDVSDVYKNIARVGLVTVSMFILVKSSIKWGFDDSFMVWIWGSIFGAALLDYIDDIINGD